MTAWRLRWCGCTSSDVSIEGLLYNRREGLDAFRPECGGESFPEGSGGHDAGTSVSRASKSATAAEVHLVRVRGRGQRWRSVAAKAMRRVMVC